MKMTFQNGVPIKLKEMPFSLREVLVMTLLNYFFPSLLTEDEQWNSTLSKM
jgi:hypothetical protein